MSERPTCELEGCNNVVKSAGRGKAGQHLWKKLCGPHHNKKYNMVVPGAGKRKKFAKLKARFKKDKTSCEHCGFVALHPCQLDVDHIDGNSDNNSPDNLQVLCANCHRLKTYINKDWEPVLNMN